jgi:hypothetical protein
MPRGKRIRRAYRQVTAPGIPDCLNLGKNKFLYLCLDESGENRLLQVIDNSCAEGIFHLFLPRIGAEGNDWDVGGEPVFLIARATWIPFISGRLRSNSIRPGLTRTALSIASLPLTASDTWYPENRRIDAKIFRKWSLSSTMRTLFPITWLVFLQRKWNAGAAL